MLITRLKNIGKINPIIVRSVYSVCRHALARRVPRLVLLLMILIGLSLPAWRAINYISFQTQDHDDAIFTSGGWLLLQGRVPYRELMEHKPPMIFAVNALALALGDGTVYSVRGMERFVAVIAVVLMGLVLLRVYNRLLLVLPFTFLFTLLFYRPALFYLGNYTEEYGCVVVLAGVLLAVLSRQSTGSRSCLWAAGAGFVFSIAVLFKEPFALSAAPWILYVLIRRDGGRDDFLKRFVITGLAVAAPLVVFFLWLYTHDAFRSWLDTFLLSFAYIESRTSGIRALTFMERMRANLPPVSLALFSGSWAASFFFLIGIIACCHAGFLKRHRYVVWPMFVSACLEYYATQLRGPEGVHYVFQLLPSFILMAGAGAAFLLYISRRMPWSQLALCVFTCMGVWIADAPELQAYKARLYKPFLHPSIDLVSRTIGENKHDGDALWINRSLMARYYTETGLTSTVRMFYPHYDYFLDTSVMTGEQRRLELLEQLKENPPRFLLTLDPQPTDGGLIGNAFKDWFGLNYTFTGVTAPARFGHQTQLYVRNGEMEGLNLGPFGESIPNGKFLNWANGVPLDFQPPDPVISEIAPVPPGDPGGEVGLRQIWHDNDTFDTPQHQFRYTIRPGAANIRYRLVVVARNLAKEKVFISLWSKTEGKHGAVFTALDAKLIQIPPGPDLQTLEYTFVSPMDDSAELLLSSSVQGHTIFPAEVIWQEWRLSQLTFPYH